MIISSIHIERFRSIDRLDIAARDLTILAGDNDTGKSNFLRALNLFFNNQTDFGESFDFAKDFNRFSSIGKRKAKEIVIELVIDLPNAYQGHGYSQAIWRKVWRADGLYLDEKHPIGRAKFPPRVRAPILLDRITFRYVPAIKDRTFFSSLLGEVYEVLSGVAERELRESSQKFEGEIEKHISGLTAEIAAFLNITSNLRLPQNLRQVFENLDFQSENRISLSQRGDGIKSRHIPVILKFLHQKQNSLQVKGSVPYLAVWGYEEPENNIEMARSFDLAAQIRAYANELQVFTTTHSPAFYSLYGEGIARYYVTKPESFSEVTPVETVEDLNLRMGFMPIVAPYIAGMKEQLSEAQARLEDAKKPAIFVEGPSDKAVLIKLLKVFGEHPDEIQVHGPEAAGGYNFVKDSVLAWHCIQTHRPNPVRAIGLFDEDDGGLKAKKEAEEKLGKSHPSVRTQKLFVTVPVRELRTKGVRLPAVLETCYPANVWQHASDKGWLVDNEEYLYLVSSPLLHQWLQDPASRFAGFTEYEVLLTTKCVSFDRKISLAQYVARLHDDNVRETFVELKPFIKSLEDWLCGA